MSEEKDFKDRLLEEISYQTLSHKEFAQKARISINTLNMYLYRNSIPSADIAIRMAKILNTSVEYLINGTNNKPKENNAKYWQKRELENIIDNLPEKKLNDFLLIARAFNNAISEI